MFPDLNAQEAEDKIVASFENREVTFQEDDQEVYRTTLKDLGYSLNKEDLSFKADRYSETEGREQEDFYKRRECGSGISDRGK